MLRLSNIDVDGNIIYINNKAVIVSGEPQGDICCTVDRRYFFSIEEAVEYCMGNRGEV